MIRNRAELLGIDAPPAVIERRHRALAAVEAALEAVDAQRATERAIERLQRRGVRLDDCVVFAFGKASVAMATAALSRLQVRQGIVHAFESGRLGPLVVEAAGHPIPCPDAAHQGERMLALARSLGPGDVALCLVSGGGSAMLEAPRHGISIAEIAENSRRLMESGADIGTLNAARRLLSRVKAGGLAEAIRPAHVVNIILSDVPGSPLDLVASGPTLGRDGIVTELCADNQTAVQAAAACLDVPAIPRVVQGDAFAVGQSLLAWGNEQLVQDTPRGFVCGGETTVRVRGPGHGGRCQELAIGAMSTLSSGLICAFGTDGVDGHSDAAGGLVDDWAAQNAPPPHDWLARSDSNAYLRALGLTVQTGPTGTNVADVMVVLR